MMRWGKAGKGSYQVLPATPIEVVTTLSDVVKYDDPVPKGHITNTHLPDAIFDKELFVYNCGHSKKNPKDFTVLIKPMNRSK